MGRTTISKTNNQMNRARRRPAATRLAGPLSLAATIALSSASCSYFETITPNAYSQSVGPEQMAADDNECFAYGSAETERLLQELLLGNPELVEREARESAAQDFARTLSDLEGGSTAAGSVAAGIADFLFSSWDPETFDEENLANYLGIERGLADGFSATTRLKHTCLRAKGYQVDRYAEDGSGTPHLVWSPRTHVVLREEDGTERVFYEYIP